MFLSEDYKAIADRQREIAIVEGNMPCVACTDTGWRQYCDEEGGIYDVECPVCHNPRNRLAPLGYQG